MAIAGGATLTLAVRADVRDFDLFANLYDYDPQSDAYVPIASAQARARYRSGATPAPVTAGQRERVSLSFVHAAYRVPRGHMLTVSLSPSRCAYLENPQTGAAVTAQASRASGTITIETGGASASALTVPVVP